MPANQHSLLRRGLVGLSCLFLACSSAPAADPKSSPPAVRLWAFEPIANPVPPAVAGAVTPLDAFVLPRVQAAGLAPSPPADSATLARRVFLDLIGLPPTPEQLRSFLADQAPGAYERLVDRLLASPHYGERWGRWWLDAARYADSNGYSIDSPRSIWPYRDWVIRALNADLPFDRFTLWQIAGDLIPEQEIPAGTPPVDLLIATGFHRNTQVNHEGGIDPEQFRLESVVDRVNTTATVWMGLTLACAQCHDHKFDPLSQRDYYRFLAFFNSCENDGHGSSGLEAENVVELASSVELAARDALRRRIADREKELRAWAAREVAPELGAWESALRPEATAKLSSLTRDTLRIPRDQRNQDQSNLVWAAFRDQHPGYRARRQEVEALKSQLPSLARTLVMKELSAPRRTTMFVKGDFTRPSDEVSPGFPEALKPTGVRSTAYASVRPLNRLDLARWLVSPEHPLTARVLVNRVWQQLFGKGLVETENDFGTQGASPSHPELLDWLASGLIRSGWSLKSLHRQIVISSTYRQSSRLTPTSAERDPLNRWLGRQNRLRLDAEIIRDVLLLASGRLETRLGGPPVFPPQPAGLGSFTQNDRPWKTSVGPDRYRRAVYTHLQRSTLHPALAVFDSADGFQTCTRRMRSNTPLQALTMLNDPAFRELTGALGRRLMRASSPSNDRERLELGLELVLSRKAGSVELDRLERFLSVERALSDATEDRVWTSVARVLLNLDEAITRE
ncbi:MAG: DUF1553 domain-containing protein [Verrucomicrobiales bacterium]|nr:DUF1553 domain-containing protein [Verrucomicrobiales bacterium]